MFLKAVDSRTEVYSQLARQHGSLFNQPEWLSIYGKDLEVVGIYSAGEELIGAFNLRIVKTYGLTLLRIPPYMPHNALFFKSKAGTTTTRIATEKQIHKLITEYLASRKSHLTLSAFPAAFSDMQVYIWNNFKVIPNYTYHLPLDHTDPFTKFSSEKRNSIRRAEKHGIEVVQTNDYALVRALVQKTFHRKQKDLSSALIDAILFRFATTENSYAFVAYQNQKPSACAFCIHDHKTAYYLLGGYDENNKHHGAGAMCVHRSVVHAQKLGLNLFDFEGSMLPEVEKYFREFGGTLTPYYTINKARLWLEMALKFKKRSIF